MLAPFALYELASAIRRRPAADIFYSDEDRLCESGERARPFFKPEWSPELLYSFMLVRKTVFDDVGGFDENLPNNFNDVDFCLRLRERGWQIVWTPYADLIHQESASRGRDSGSAERAQLLRDMAYMQEKWGEHLQNDPFYSPNLSESVAFTPAWPPRIPLLLESLKSAKEQVFVGPF